MTYNEINGDLFDIENTHNYTYLAHCISADAAMGKGIAIQFQKRYNLRDKILSMNPEVGDALFVGNTINLVTKEKYWQKPTYASITECIENMKTVAIVRGVKFIAMPAIGCGLDRLKWEKVKEIIMRTFSNTDINITVCFK